MISTQTILSNLAAKRDGYELQLAPASEKKEDCCPHTFSTSKVSSVPQ